MHFHSPAPCHSSARGQAFNACPLSHLSLFLCHTLGAITLTHRHSHTMPLFRHVTHANRCPSSSCQRCSRRLWCIVAMPWLETGTSPPTAGARRTSAQCRYAAAHMCAHAWTRAWARGRVGVPVRRHCPSWCCPPSLIWSILTHLISTSTLAQPLPNPRLTPCLTPCPTPAGACQGA